ncbi:heparan-sulfate 6-O-sulfotransferase 3-B-like [Haliotis rufescens]|uniref:heparan-sulfate 6-O-sulfotransferase 3-B-like n=1 Tax=Haliotis rufescens TaxID=6454 RepID=UPI001EB09DCC|nr:heparan-sulfate 6-O-sulfotransferase 3-B-like [Haliotis rufescens]
MRLLTLKKLFAITALMTTLCTLFVSFKASHKSFVKTSTQQLHSLQISPLDDYETYTLGKLTRHNFPVQDLIRNINVSVTGSDVLVFLRIQKTGSTTFENHLQHNLNLKDWCQRNASKNLLSQPDCQKKWRYNVLFKFKGNELPCLTHADWTYFHECVDAVMKNDRRGQINQRHLYVTMVRDPLRRFLSEWKQVSERAATWIAERIICNGHAATKAELPPCFSKNWLNVTLDGFMECASNLGINRQTRMLANLSIVGCYNTSVSGFTFDERHYRMLASAKENLRNMAYFGLTGYQELSQILFENTFNLNFVKKFKYSSPSKTWSGRVKLSNAQRDKILHLNRFDVMLYQYAKDLFFQRLQMVAERTKDSSLRKFIHTKIGPKHIISGSKREPTLLA